MRWNRSAMLLARVLLVGCAVVAAACGGSGAKLEKLDRDAVILAFGDSLTYGTGAARDEAYPAVLERLVGRKVVNAGVPGETSAQGLERLPEVLDEVKPQLLVLCHGGNDFLRRLGEPAAAANVKAMIRLARDREIPVVLLATPRPGVPPGIPAFYGEIAAELGVPFEEGVLRTVLFDNRLKSDLVHPNAKGYAEIAAAVRGTLERAGAI